MPYVPKPPRPSTFQEWKEDAVTAYRTWYANGEPRNSGVKTENLVVANSRVYNRTRNKVRVVKGSLWKPCTDYGCATFEVSRLSGSTFLRNSSGQSIGVLTGPITGIGYQTWTPSFVGGFSGLLPHDPPRNVRNRLATELMQKVGARKTSYGESLAEARQTVGHLAKTVSSVAKALLAARRGRWGKVAEHLGVPFKRTYGKTAAEKWLEYQYAWMPLLGDIYDTHALLQDGFRKKAMMMSSVRVLSDTETLKGNTFEAKVRRGHATVKYRGKVFYRVNDSALSKLNQLGLINPLEVAWAIVPYSFVIDWFIPVGNYLEALSARLGVDFVDGFYSVTVESNASIWPRVTSLWGPLGSVDPEKTSTTMCTVSSLKSFRRWRYTGFPVPGLYYKNPFSSNHVTSALALLRQLTR